MQCVQSLCDGAVVTLLEEDDAKTGCAWRNKQLCNTILAIAERIAWQLNETGLVFTRIVRFAGIHGTIVIGMMRRSLGRQ